MVFESRHERLRIIVSEMNNEESGTYYYSWVVTMPSKETKDM
jgi:hypothetical protein